MKTCFKCKEQKSKSEFYKHSGMADGYLNKCKSCAKEDASRHRNSNLDRIREYDRKRSKEPERMEMNGVRTKAFRTEFPKKYAAHRMVGNAIRDGKLFREPCEICGSNKSIYAHHDDYSKPLNIRWLCCVHHKEWHKNNGEGKNV